MPRAFCVSRVTVHTQYTHTDWHKTRVDSPVDSVKNGHHIWGSGSERSDDAREGERWNKSLGPHRKRESHLRPSLAQQQPSLSPPHPASPSVASETARTVRGERHTTGISRSHETNTRHTDSTVQRDTGRSTQHQEDDCHHDSRPRGSASKQRRRTAAGLLLSRLSQSM